MAYTISLPTKFRLTIPLAAAAVLFAVQLMSGTDLVFSTLIFLYILLLLLSVNNVRGLATLSGFCIAMMGIKIVVISQIAKLIFWQPADSLLEVPDVTAGVLLVSMVGIFAATVIARHIRFRNEVLKPVLDPKALKRIWAASYIFGVITYIAVQLYGIDELTERVLAGGIVGFLRQFTFVYSLSVVAATAYTIVSSNRCRSFGLITAISIITQLIGGILATSKIAISEPFVMYLLTCIAFRFPFKWKHLGGAALAAILLVSVLYPLAQIGRSYARTSDFSYNVSALMEVANKGQDDWKTQLENFNNEADAQFQYYGKDMGILDRFSLIEQADELVAATLATGASGWLTIEHGFKLMVPHFLYPDKPLYNSANFLGHRIGIIGEEDETTQITFGLVAESFSAFEWAGAAIIPFVLNLLFFVIYKKLVGDIFYNIWAVWLFGIFQHAFVETTIATMLNYLIRFPVLLIFTYFLLMVLVQRKSLRVPVRCA